MACHWIIKLKILFRNPLYHNNLTGNTAVRKSFQSLNLLQREPKPNKKVKMKQHTMMR